MAAVSRQASIVRPSTKGYGLKNVYFMVRCEKEDHDDCSSMRTAVFHSYPSIMSTRNCRVAPNFNRFCVTGRALVLRENLADFERTLKNVVTDDPEPVGVADLDVLVSM